MNFVTASFFLLFVAVAVLTPASQPGAAQGAYTIAWKDRLTRQSGSFTYKESHALIVGVSEYTNWPNLEAVKDDVTEVKAALERLGFHVVVKVNLQYGDMVEAYRDFIRQYGLDPDSRLLFYFAGHGYTLPNSYGEKTDPEDWMGVLLPQDAPMLPRPGVPKELALFRSNGHFLPIAQFSLWAKEIQARHVLFLFDSCFSGATGFDLSTNLEQISGEITQWTKEPTRQFITAGTANQAVPQKSIFRRQFIDALKGAADSNRDGYVTGSELGAFLKRKVTEYSNKTQTPQYGKLLDPRLDKGDFIFPLSGTVQCVATPPPASLSLLYTNSLGMQFVLISAGEFTMGAEESTDSANAKPAHKVSISRPFYIGKFEVTQGQWSTLMETNPSHFTGDPQLPVENVSWTEVQEFIRRLNAREGSPRYRLPTEAEWEYAARACAATDYSFGNDVAQLGQYAWFDENADKRTHVVGKLQPNAWGLHDVQGNVWEWCQDWYGDYPADAVRDPTGSPQGAFRVYRGGGWYRGASSLYCRLASRHGARPTFRHPALGFRLVLTVPSS
ncbi:MAG TPA: SUMF1/EgtB/PvdO family nonheme iron enzyme [Methylomirabilota bacterium]|jgi:formylglycine-generating enzyme required for sulfatase activity|nr:SUMF1/EgtB/PvdO family nonheme iron enzyme [Methylomirabilota bacterium]